MLLGRVGELMWIAWRCSSVICWCLVSFGGPTVGPPQRPLGLSTRVYKGSSPPSPSLLALVFLVVVILTRVRWNLSVVLICLSFMARDIGSFHVFIGHLHFFFGELSVQLIFLFSFIFFTLFNFLGSLYILNVNPC